MTTIISLLRHKLAVRCAGLAALCVLIWFVGPKIAFGKKVPLGPEFNRLLAIMVVLVLWALYHFIQQSRSRKKEQQLMTDLAADPKDASRAAVEEMQSKEVAELRRKFEHALQSLKTARSKGWRGSQYLYELPWYVIIGAPGCGKTTLLANSGLRFPLSGKVDRDDIQGVGGTRNCDWLFTDDAIFLDTAGRYTTQDSHQPVDAGAWHGFLGLIKKHRPRRPINGVLVATSLSDMLRQTEEQCRQQARHIRQRVSELSDKLGIRFPVYMIFTKCDLVAGFTELFAQLSSDERIQVWGETFMTDGSNQIQERIDDYINKFEASLRSLTPRILRRIQEERDIQRRSLILDFPQQMALLKPRVKDFLHQAFSSNPYEKYAPQLRGVYLTSATQEGTPIDRVMGLLASTYGLDRQHAPVFSGQGQSYFITRLLKEVIFPEAQLAGADPRMERRRRFMQLAAYVSVLILAAGTIALWATSYARNSKAIGQIEDQIVQYNRTVENDARWDEAVKSLLVRLNIITAAYDVYENRSLWMGFGLGQGDKLQAGINGVYSRLLKNRFLPLVKARLEHRIHALLYKGAEDDFGVLYELLRTYLMLGEPRRLEPLLAARRVGHDWKRSFLREPELHGQLDRHTNSLFHLSLDPIQLNENLIEEARRVLNTQPLYAQIFAHMQAEAMLDRQYAFQLKDVLGPHGDKVFITADGQKLEALTIPGLFTHDGYHGFFVKKGLRYVKQALKENWVLNNYAADQESDLSRLYDDLQKYYFSQYEKQWRRLLDNLKVKKARGITQEIEILDILSGSENPLRLLMASIEKNTVLYKSSPSEQTDSGAENEEDLTSASSLADQAFQQQEIPARALELERRFRDIHYLVRSNGNAPSPLDHLLENLNILRDYMMQIGSAAGSDERALQIALERIHGGGASTQIKAAQMDFARQPEPLNSWFSSLTSSSLEFTLSSAKSELNTAWKAEVLVPFEAALQGRYPIYNQSDADVTMDDFSRFFMPNGTIDRFFQNHLKSFVDMTGRRWRPRRIDNQTMHLSSGTLLQLQHAAAIRDAFFAGGGSSPSLHFELIPVDLDDNVAAFSIDIEGQTAEYSHGPTRPRKFVWPGPNAGAGVRLTFETIDGQHISHLEKGAWAWLKIMDMAKAESTNQRDRIMITFQLRNCSVRYELRAGSVYHPFQLKALRDFRCPESL
jgi:type VI secretion system protein ImpL